MTGILDHEARQLVRRVQELRDERDELLDILAAVVDSDVYDGTATSIATIPAALMQEMRRRVAENLQ